MAGHILPLGKNRPEQVCRPFKGSDTTAPEPQESPMPHRPGPMPAPTPTPAPLAGTGGGKPGIADGAAPPLPEALALLGGQGVRAASFDVFDTLLLRNTTGPDGVFDLTWSLLRDQAGTATTDADRHFPTLDAFHRLRHEAHTLAILTAGGREVDIDAIYAEFPLTALGWGEEMRPRLAAMEFEAEQRLCHGDPDVVALFLALKAAGKRVGVISDTYWPRQRLLALLRGAIPGFEPDFVYASCDWGAPKARGLFTHYLREEGLEPEQAAHIGDNHAADVHPARPLGLRAHHHPQAPDLLLSVFQREKTLARLLRGLGAGERGPAAPPFTTMPFTATPGLDGGLAARRRRAARPLPLLTGTATPPLCPPPTPRSPYAAAGDADIADLLGACVVAPLIAGLDHRVRQTVAEVQARGRRVGVLFMARDGYLPWLAWQQREQERALGPTAPSAYVGLNRRICLAACADDIGVLQGFFMTAPRLNAVSVDGFLKVRLPAVARYFASQPDGSATGTDFAQALPGLLNPGDLADIAAGLRRRTLTHLRQALRTFDRCDDLVLVDIGYNGTIHRALQSLLRREGVIKRVHGVYLLAGPSARRALPDGDSGQGLIDEHVLPAQSLDYVIRNVLVMEHFCAAPTGSISDHAEDGSPLFEPDLRPAPQKQACAEVQRACLAALALYPAPTTPQEEALQRHWAGIMLARLCLMPTARERALLGPFIHDINLGSRAHGALEDAASARLLFTAMDVPTACTAPPPPFWMAASVNALSPALGHAYVLTACGLMPGDVHADQADGTVRVELVHAGGTQTLNARRLRTAQGDWRVHIPVARVHADGVVAVRLGDVAPAGILEPVCLRAGDSPRQAMRSTLVRAFPRVRLGTMGLDLADDGTYRIAAHDIEEARLMIALPGGDAAMVLLTLVVRTPSPLAP